MCLLLHMNSSMKLASRHHSKHSRYQIWGPHTIQIRLSFTILIHGPHPPTSPGHRPHPPTSTTHTQDPLTSPTHGLAPPTSPTHRPRPTKTHTHRPHPPTIPTHGLAPPRSPTHEPQPSTSPTHGHGPPLGQSSGADTLLGERTTAQPGGLYTDSYNTGHNGKHSLPPSTERIPPMNATPFCLHDCMAYRLICTAF